MVRRRHRHAVSPSRAVLPLLLGLLLASPPARGGAVAAAAEPSTLDAVLRKGRIAVAIDMNSAPYATTDPEGRPQGSDVEAARLLADDLGVELEIVPTTGPGRIPVLLSGKADLTMATFSITPERAKSVAFGNPYGVIRSVVLAPEEAAIRGPEDLAGRRVGVTLGTTQEAEIARTAPTTAEIVTFPDDAASLHALAAGTVDAIGTAENRAFAINGGASGRRFVAKYDLGLFYYGVGMRRGDPDLLRWVNTWVFFNLQNGKLGAIYRRWLGRDLPSLPAY